MWRKNILSHKRAKARRLLEEKLFMLDDIFRPKLLIHRDYCCEMEKLRFVDIAKASQESSILEDFSAEQQKHKETISEQI